MGHPISIRNRKIRLAVCHLKGEARTNAILLYASNPEELAKALQRKMVRTRKTISFTLRLSGAEYMKLLERADKAGQGMSDYARGRLGL
jgi:hypothetical protein